ncbi:stalk domain-containing protein [Paenibacillus thailandensis]|uniref:Stalk domain-containing protein n=1 Tax=Paenibacillus thailandensis TaxID=393250 RepID=A0ABW5R1A3_9BACL
MFRKFTMAMLAALLLVSASLPAQAGASGVKGSQSLTLLQNSAKMFQNGAMYMATQPMTEKKGVTYVSLRSIAERLYSTLSYDSSAKEYIVTYGQSTLRYKVGRSAYIYNGEQRSDTAGTPYIQNGTLMVPIRSLVKPYGITLTINKAEKKLVLAWTVRPVAKFTVSPKEIYAGQTEVAYNDLAYHPVDVGIVGERWEGKQTMFESAGQYTITRWVQDENGVWSEPYSLTVQVKKPNSPPVAMFETDKDSYQMGEPIEFEDLSTDEENGIVKREWTNKEKAFFEPGLQTISLTVTDAQGATDTYTKTITITNSTLYSKEEFDLLFTDPGEKLTIDGASVLEMNTIEYTSLNNYGQMTLVRSNSPETIVSEGIYYKDTLNGNIRLFAHHQNGMEKDVRIYVVATNKGRTDATLTVQRVGAGGPAASVSGAGKMAGARYLEARTKPAMNKQTVIPAGTSQTVLTDLSDKAMSYGDIVTYYADIHTTSPLEFQIVILDKNKDVLKTLPYLNVLDVDGKHTRGTFELANRTINILNPIGGNSRMVLTDNNLDKYMTGTDSTTGTAVVNLGNYGMMYVITLRKVQPNTLIAVNPRGGHYGGSFLVNNNLVYMTNNSILTSNKDAGVLYRTGDSTESVTIAFTPASGSNLPINFVFLPLPEKK